MLSVAGLHKAYGGQQVLTDVTWAVADGARVGLAGPNGAGKSTLLRILAGEVEPDRGAVALPKGAQVGYLPQHILGARGITVLGQAMTAFADLHALEARRATVEHELATVDPSDPRYGDVMERYMAVCDEWEHRGRYDTESEAETVLHGLGFHDDDMERDCGELSGGWQMRVALATLLLQRPEVLLLDEPTNYLDDQGDSGACADDRDRQPLGRRHARGLQPLGQHLRRERRRNGSPPPVDARDARDDHA
jgi:ATP-binding cassette subfamily F protein 3